MKFIRFTNAKLYMLLVILLGIYAPVELTRIIVICTWQNTILNHALFPGYYFIIELAFFWTFQITGWVLVYLRIKRTKRTTKKTSAQLRAEVEEWHY